MYLWCSHSTLLRFPFPSKYRQKTLSCERVLFYERAACDDDEVIYLDEMMTDSGLFRLGFEGPDARDEVNGDHELSTWDRVVFDDYWWDHMSKMHKVVFAARLT
eukprot:m.270920 g.270920  ORF g.270920 m.270920 type:complete len:104 (+) comp50082_c0_seq1:256-567(+)